MPKRQKKKTKSMSINVGYDLSKLIEKVEIIPQPDNSVKVYFINHNGDTFKDVSIKYPEVLTIKHKYYANMEQRQ